jgi:hypothetical protein
MNTYPGAVSNYKNTGSISRQRIPAYGANPTLLAASVAVRNPPMAPVRPSPTRGTQTLRATRAAASMNLAQKEWRMPPREWTMAKAQFAILFEDRFRLN